MLEFIDITNGGRSADIDIHVATTMREEGAGTFGGSVIELVIIAHTAVACLIRGIQAIAHGTQTATAVDGAKHGTAINVDIDAAAHVTGRIGVTGKAATAAEDITVYVAGTPGANQRCVADVHIHIAHHVTVLTAAEYRAVDATTRDVHYYPIDISLLVEEHTLVTLTCAEEVAGHRMSSNLSQRAGNAERGRAAEADGSSSGRGIFFLAHIGQLITTIDVGQNMTTGDGDGRVAAYGTSLKVPFAWCIRIFTTTTAKDVTIERVAVVAYSTTALRIIVCSSSKLIVWSIFICI